MGIAPGDIIADRFELERELARGGMGSVWVAKQLSLDAPCAVKVIDAAIAHDEHVRARFEREARAMARIRSPHVVQILDHGTHEGQLYIAMELMEGESLEERLERDGCIRAAKVVDIVAQGAEALAVAHEAGVVHRDLKPSNIYLVKKRGGDHLKLCDLGVAKAEEGPQLETKSGSLLGTPYYMSPEQIDSPASVDHRADLWALAVIAYECLTGVRPFDFEELSKLISAIVRSDSPDPSELGAPAAFDAWWRRATHPEIARRFDDAMEMAHALELALAGELDGEAPQSSRNERSAMISSADTVPGAARSVSASSGITAETMSPTQSTVPVEEVPLERSRVLPAALVVLGLGGLVAIGYGVRDGSATSSPATPPATTEPTDVASAIVADVRPDGPARVAAAEPSASAASSASLRPPVPAPGGGLGRPRVGPTVEPSAAASTADAQPVEEPLEKQYGF